jgi:hypothetical protein
MQAIRRAATLTKSLFRRRGATRVVSGYGLNFRSRSVVARRLLQYGAVAQLGERLVRNEEVSGSIPLSSTIESKLYEDFEGTISRLKAFKEQEGNNSSLKFLGCLSFIARLKHKRSNSDARISPLLPSVCVYVGRVISGVECRISSILTCRTYEGMPIVCDRSNRKISLRFAYEQASSFFGSKRNMSGKTQYSGSASSRIGAATAIRCRCARRMRR